MLEFIIKLKDGRVISTPAMPDEINIKGNLIDLIIEGKEKGLPFNATDATGEVLDVPMSSIRSVEFVFKD